MQVMTGKWRVAFGRSGKGRHGAFCFADTGSGGSGRILGKELKSLFDRPSRSVLWLNDIDKFLTKGVLSLRVANLVLRELGLQIVATIRSKAYVDFNRRDYEIGRDTQQVLQCAEAIIKVEERMTPEEDQRAREYYPDLNLGPGLGESFIAGQELKDRYDYGESPMRAVVRAANDWRRTGFTSPIQYDDLFSLFKGHLEDLEPAQDATDEVFKSALEDARTPVARYSALLYKKQEAYQLSDYVSDYLESEDYPILKEAWKLALARVLCNPSPTVWLLDSPHTTGDAWI
jgi:hypothetical protein